MGICEEQNYGRFVAENALRRGITKFDFEKPFEWASGFRMPTYSDYRLLLFHSDIRSVIADVLEEMILEETSNQGIVLAGTATAGIPWASLTSERLDCPLVYIRAKPKDQGLKNQIEGLDAESDLQGEEVHVIEDVIATGGSSAAAVQAVRDARGNCNYCFSIFNYGFNEAQEMFNGRRPFDREGARVLSPACELKSILDYETLLNVAREMNYVTPEQIKVLEEWRADPWNWGEKQGFPRVLKEKKA